MLTNSYLYGDDFEVPDVPAYIVMCRVVQLKDRLAEVQEVEYMLRNHILKEDLLKAIEFWETINDR